MQALGSIGPEAAATVPALVEFLSDQDEGAAWGAAMTLAKMGEAAVTPLIEGLKSHKLRLRSACATALGRIGPGANQPRP
jgi:HEAT repeat protein